MPEPLKGKLFCFECEEYESEDEGAEWCPRYRGFRKEDVKSACEWLLNEIRKIQKHINTQLEIIGSRRTKERYQWEGMREALFIAEGLIKRAFTDIFEEELKDEFIKELKEAEKNVKEGKASKYTIDEFKEKFDPN